MTTSLSTWMASVKRLTSISTAIPQPYFQVPQVTPPRVDCLEVLKGYSPGPSLMGPYSASQQLALLSKAVRQPYIQVPHVPPPRVDGLEMLKSSLAVPSLMTPYSTPQGLALRSKAIHQPYLQVTQVKPPQVDCADLLRTSSAVPSLMVSSAAVKTLWSVQAALERYHALLSLRSWACLDWDRCSPVWLSLATRRLSARAVERQLDSVGAGVARALCLLVPAPLRQRRSLDWISESLGGAPADRPPPTRREIANYLARRVRRLLPRPAQSVFRLRRDDGVQRVRWPALLTTLQPSAP